MAAGLYMALHRVHWNVAYLPGRMPVGNGPPGAGAPGVPGGLPGAWHPRIVANALVYLCLDHGT
jgi:hypothetical protein